ncbi:SET and MYND domain-containing protein 4 [Trichomycterus rosablanca]|uniref:SET and MYND domain-containing protein 4 n=1 Tax=Trichomycterus rosablanca TaxID=2290929 RepID=UPI002F355791
MDLPCQKWIKHVKQRWTELGSAGGESFTLLTDIDELFHTAQSQVQEEDLKVLASISEKYQVKKSSEDAAKCREQGNISFKIKDYISAALYYTRGVCYAIKNSEQISLCYANRSAALFHLGFYDECLVDIQRALDEGYPSQLQRKLLDRRSQCLNQLEKQKHLKTLSAKCETQETKKSKDGNSCLSSTVCVHFSPENGRHLLVAGSKSAGEVIFQDEAFSLVLIPDNGQSDEVNAFGTELRHCHHCLCETLSSVPCQGCSYAQYCGQKCEKEAWRQYHCWECPIGSELKSLGLFAHLSLRVTLKAGIKDVQRARERCSNSANYVPEVHCARSDVCNSKTDSIPDKCSESFAHSGCFNEKSYLDIYNLLPYVNKHSPSLRFLLAFTMAALCQRLELARPATCELQKGSCCWGHERKILGPTALRHMMQLRCNAQAVTTIKVKESSSPSLAVQSSKEIRIATAVFPILSLLNHSCCPNTSISFSLGFSSMGKSGPVSFASGVTVSIRASQDIAAGQELLHCYGPHCKRMDVKERQRQLMEQYFFQCHCQACKQQLGDETRALPLILSGLKCEKCGSSLQSRVDVHVCSQSSCHHHISNAELEDKIQILKHHMTSALQLMKNHKYDQAIRVLQDASTKASSILMKTHPLQGEIADATARAYASLGNWRQAASHLKQSVIAVGCQYGEDSLELGRQLFKLAQLHFNGGDIQSACSVIPKAQRLLSLHLDPCCEELQELQAMEACLNSTST